MSLFAALLTLTTAPAGVPAEAPVRPLSVDGGATQGALLRGRVPPGTRTLTLDGVPVPFAPDGRFVIGLDRDARATARLVASAPGTRIERTISIAPRAWRIERVPTVARVTVPSAEFRRRRPAELAQINAARAQSHDAGGWAQRFVWPVKGRLSGLFGSQRVYANGERGSYHSGADVAVPTGTPIVAPADGVVILATSTPFTLEGKLLLVDHGMGLSSAFLHLSRIDVAKGDRVRQGQPIGAVGATGRASGPHLHWAIKWRAARLDPLLVAGPMGR